METSPILPIAANPARFTAEHARRLMDAAYVARFAGQYGLPIAPSAAPLRPEVCAPAP